MKRSLILLILFFLSCSDTDQCRKKHPGMLGREVVISYPVYAAIFKDRKSGHNFLSTWNYEEVLNNPDFEKLHELSCGDTFSVSSFRVKSVPVPTTPFNSNLCIPQATLNAGLIKKITFDVPSSVKLPPGITKKNNRSLVSFIDEVNVVCKRDDLEEHFYPGFPNWIEVGDTHTLKPMYGLFGNTLPIDSLTSWSVLPNESDLDVPAIELKDGTLEAERLGVQCINGEFSSKSGRVFSKYQCIESVKTLRFKHSINFSHGKEGELLPEIDKKKSGITLSITPDPRYGKNRAKVSVEASAPYELLKETVESFELKDKLAYTIYFNHPQFGKGTITGEFLKYTQRFVAISKDTFTFRIKSYSFDSFKAKKKGIVEYSGSKAQRLYYNLIDGSRSYSMKEKEEIFDEIVALKNDALEIAPGLIENFWELRRINLLYIQPEKIIAPMGSAAIPALKEALKLDSQRDAAAFILSTMGKSGREAIPSLIDALYDVHTIEKTGSESKATRARSEFLRILNAITEIMKSGVTPLIEEDKTRLIGIIEPYLHVKENAGLDEIERTYSVIKCFSTLGPLREAHLISLMSFLNGTPGIREKDSDRLRSTMAYSAGDMTFAAKELSPVLFEIFKKRENNWLLRRGAMTSLIKLSKSSPEVLDEIREYVTREGEPPVMKMEFEKYLTQLEAQGLE